MKFIATFGFVALAVGAHATLFTFDGGGVTINDNAVGSPSPLVFNVTGLDGPITNVGIYFSGMSHTSPDDVGAVLLSSSGLSTILFDGPGLGPPVNPVWDWKFDEFITSTRLSDNSDNPTGFYAAGQNQWNDIFTDAPAGPYGTTLKNYIGMSAANGNGQWKLFIQDFVAGDAGAVQDIQLRINTVPEPASIAVLGLGAIALVRRRKRN